MSTPETGGTWAARSRAGPVLALLAASAASCMTVEVASHNLDEVMAPSNRFSYSADVVSAWRYYVRQVFRSSWADPESPWRSAEPKPVKNPSGVALENLLVLGTGSSYGTNDYRDAQLVRQFSRYAAYAPSALCRERALIELGEICDRLELVGPVFEHTEAANAVELSEALSGLVDAMAPILTKKEPNPTERRDFAAACRLLAQREYDIEGGRRVLRVIASLSEKTRLDGEEFIALRELSQQVQREIVGQALARGRVDPNPMVRAAGYVANWRAYGQRFLDEAMRSLVVYDARNPESAQVVTPELRLPAILPQDEEVFVATLNILATAGLPPSARGDSLDAREARWLYLFVMTQIAYDFALYGDRTRTAAMIALENVSDSGLQTLREEDWEEWWAIYGPAERADIQRLRAEAVQGRP